MTSKMCTLINFVSVEAYLFGKRSEYIFCISYHRFMCLYTSLLDLKEWAYDTDQANYQILCGFHFPPTHYHGSCESNLFICLKMTYPLSFFSIVVEQTFFFLN